MYLRGTVVAVPALSQSVQAQGVGVRVLIVSNDPLERLRAASAIGRDDAEVVELDGAEPMRRLVLREREHFDVMVIDGDLDPRGGYAALYDVRSRADLDGTAVAPTLILASRPQDGWLAEWSGANDWLIKPVDPFVVATRVRKLVGADVPDYGAHQAAAEQVAMATRQHRVRR